jgi:hypothetical protein
MILCEIFPMTGNIASGRDPRIGLRVKGETMNKHNHSDKTEPAFGPSSLLQDFRLLYPAQACSDASGSDSRLFPQVWHDLGVQGISAAFTSNREYQREIDAILSVLIHEPEVIRYRQEIIADFLENPSLVKRLADQLPVIDSLASFSYSASRQMSTLHEVAWRIGELQSIIDCLQGLADIFRDMRGQLTSAGLKILGEEIQKAIQNPIFQSLARELPELMSKTRTCASVTIGVNLDACARFRPHCSRSMMNRLATNRC